MNTVNDIRTTIQEALTQEREKLADARADDWHGHELGLQEGWVDGLEYAFAVVDKAIPTIMDWNRIQDEAIIGLHRVAIAQLEGGNVEEAIGVLTSTINQLRGVRVGDLE